MGALDRAHRLVPGIGKRGAVSGREQLRLERPQCDAGVYRGHRDLHVAVQPAAQLVKRADVVAVPVGDRDAPDRGAGSSAAAISASPLPATVVSTSVRPSSSRTKNAFTQRILVSWIRFGVI
jgi:hypothetical protein